MILIPNTLVSRLVGAAAVLGMVSGGVVGRTAEEKFSPQGGEFSIAGAIRGDQTKARISTKKEGGYIVWQDNATDGDGLGISATRLDSNFNPVLGNFRVNQAGSGDQELPQVAQLKDGGSVFVWQSSPLGVKRIVARFLDAHGKFVSEDLPVSPDNGQGAAVVSTGDGGAVISWSSLGSDGSLLGVVAQKFSAAGQKIGNPIRVNQTTQSNQKAPALGELPDGRLAVAWVSEQQRSEGSSDIYIRVLNPDLSSASSELRVNGSKNVCANPSVAVLATGAVVVAWSQKDVDKPRDGWDVASRVFDSTSMTFGDEQTCNETVPGDQYAPQISVIGSDTFVCWTSFGQDGSREGVYGRFILASGGTERTSPEFLVNTTTRNQQLHPAVASDSSGKILVVWSAFKSLATGFDVMAQRFSRNSLPLEAPGAPIVTPISSSRVSVTWPEMIGLGSVTYELYMNDGLVPIKLKNNYFLSPPSAPGTTMSFKIAYRFEDGRQSPLSTSASGATWGEDINNDGLPDDWQALHFGVNSSDWPGALEDSDGDGANNIREFLTGTDPKRKTSVLRARIEKSSQGPRLVWNTEPGLVYQVQSGKSLGQWESITGARFAVSSTDSVPVPGSAAQGYFRVIRLK